MKAKVKLKGYINSRNRTYYSKLYPKAKEVFVSDYCPNGPFQRPESVGYRISTKDDVKKAYRGMKLWHRAATTAGAHKTYVKL